MLLRSLCSAKSPSGEVCNNTLPALVCLDACLFVLALSALSAERKRQMITYFFADGTRSNVEGLPQEVEEIAANLTRLEENLERKERYHTVSLDSQEYEGLDFASREPNALEILETREATKERVVLVAKALAALSEKQKRRIAMRFFEGLTLEEIAKREQVSLSSLHGNISVALKKMKGALEKNINHKRH